MGKVVLSSGPVVGATMKDFNMPAYYFLHCSSGRSWPTDDPHEWLLDRRDDDLLAPARERLIASPDDAERCIRIALRRCSLALVQVVSDVQVVVRHWGDPAPDLKTRAKENRVARTDVVVTTENVKTGTLVVHQDGGDILLHGEQVGQNFPWTVYAAKYERRGVEEQNDQDAASASFTNFVWPDVTAESLSWRLLKSMWNAEAVPCPNCDTPLVIVGIDWRMGLLSFRSARVVRHCLRCRRRVLAAEEEPLAWLAKVLPPLLRPTYLLLWKLTPINWHQLSLVNAPPVQLAGREG